MLSLCDVLPIDMLWLWVARVLNNVAPTQLIRLIVSEVHVAPNQELPYQAPLICSNGGRALVIGCIQSQQCLPFTKESVACLQGICCTVVMRFAIRRKVSSNGMCCTMSEICR
uniref:Bm2724, isoform a n=1 Tax=Brugia malayi TaxID=6279 RepID=A0A1I9G4P5_BRUMA|nr:Bm2724, isoform a [Brugia malayi]